jgi:hypothetical protein
LCISKTNLQLARVERILELLLFKILLGLSSSLRALLLDVLEQVRRAMEGRDDDRHCSDDLGTGIVSIRLDDA